MTDHTPATLIAFRDRVAQAFRDKRIRSPVHFPSDTQAQPLVSIFKDFREGDWLFSGWRSMWHALLAGIPEDELFQMILDGRSMYIQSKRHRVFCSSIVGGILPIALGVAWAVKRNWERLQAEATAMMEMMEVERHRVWVCVGEMTARTGLYHEFFQYARGFGLPIRIVHENNGLSTNAPTDTVWGQAWFPPLETGYKYTRTHPHVGLQERVSF